MFHRTKLKALALSLTLGLALLFPLASFAGDPLWIDVRTAAEFNAGHVDEAVNIPYDEIAAGIGALDVGENEVIYVYCRSGRRSGIAKDTLEGLGYSQVFNIGGLEDALKKAGQEPGR